MIRNNFSKLFVSLVVVVATLLGCKDPNRIVPDRVGDKAISFSSNIYLRPVQPMRAYDNTWEAGDQISVYMLKSGAQLNSSVSTAELFYKGASYKAKNTGAEVAFEPTEEKDKMFFPAGESVDFVAYHPASIAPQSDYTIALNVEASPIDLLYSNNLKAKNQESKAKDLLLTFQHALSSLRIVLKKESGEAIEDASIKVEGLNTKALFSLADGTISNLEAKKQINLSTKNNYYSHIILPQSIAGGEAKMVINYNSRLYEYSIPAINIEQGKQVYYEFKLGIDKIEAIVAGVIRGWDEILGGSGTLTPKPIPTPPAVENIAPIEYFAEYDVNMDGTGFTTDHANGSSGHFNFYVTNGIKHDTYNPTGKRLLDNEAFNGWHVPHYNELHILMSKNLLDASDDPVVLKDQKERIMVKGDTQEYLADYDRSEAKKHHVCNDIYALRFKGHGDHYRSAYRYQRMNNPEGGALPGNECVMYVITVRYLGPDNTNITLEDIKQASFWSDASATYIKRIFPASGYSEPATPGVRKSMGKGGWYWSSSVHSDIPQEEDEDEDFSYASMAIGLLFAELHWDATVRGFQEKVDGYAVRLVKD